MMKGFFIYDVSLCSLIERPLRRAACPESIRRVQGSVLYSPSDNYRITIDNSLL